MSIVAAADYILSYKVGYTSPFTTEEWKEKVEELFTSQKTFTIIKAYKFCENWEAAAILCICFSTKSKLRREFKKNGHNFLWEKDMSFGKDGYLSVNSLIGMLL